MFSAPPIDRVDAPTGPVMPAHELDALSVAAARRLASSLVRDASPENLPGGLGGIPPRIVAANRVETLASVHRAPSWPCWPERPSRTATPADWVPRSCRGSYEKWSQRPHRVAGQRPQRVGVPLGARPLAGPILGPQVPNSSAAKRSDRTPAELSTYRDASANRRNGSFVVPVRSPPGSPNPERTSRRDRASGTRTRIRRYEATRSHLGYS